MTSSGSIKIRISDKFVEGGKKTQKYTRRGHPGGKQGRD